MKSHFGISIPTKPYLAKYLQALYGSPIVFSTGNYFGTSLLGYLNSRIYLQTESITFQKFNTFNCPILIYLPKYWLRARQYKTELTQANVIYLNKHFEERFEEDLVNYCWSMSLVGWETKRALEEFCVIHNIEIDVDITYDNLKQKEFRQRRKQQHRKKNLEKCVSKFVLQVNSPKKEKLLSGIANPFNLSLEALLKQTA